METLFQRLLFGFLCCILLAAHASAYEVKTDERVVVFADVHGAYDDWVALLQELKVIDGQLNWVAGKTHLVSLGDLVDRGPGSRDVVELMMHLEDQAERAGGAVHMILGNHEIMVMTGDLRFVTRAEFAAFAEEETAADRDEMYAQFVKYNPGTSRAEFDENFPPGFVALRKAYSLDGKFGRWLAQKPFVVKINDKIYMHGGVSKDLSGDTISEINNKLQVELRDYLSATGTLREAGQLPWYVSEYELLPFLNTSVSAFAEANPDASPAWYEQVKQLFDMQEMILVDPSKSPTWYRGTTRCHPLSESFNTESFLKTNNAQQLVVGHDPYPGRVLSRMEDLVIRLDTGMLKSVYKGIASAMVINDGPDYIHYLGSGKRAQPTPEKRDLSMQLSGMSDAELEDFMRSAPVTNVEEIGTGVTNPWRVTQERDGVTNDAVFKYEDTNPGMQDSKKYITRRYNDSDRYQYDVAAYKIDRMLDWQMVPASVISEVKGKEGALSDWVTGAINERDRLEQELPFRSYCPQWEQYRLRFVFDILIHNVDRNLTNILWTRDSKGNMMMKFIDHSLAFRTSDKRPKQYRKVDLEVSDLLASRLQRLNEQNLTQELRPYLHPRQIEAILERRDRILKEAVRTGK